MCSGVRQRISRGRCTIALLVLYLLSAVHLGAAEMPCPPWNAGSQAQLTSTAIPQELERVLRYHQGNGFLAQFEEEKHIRMLRRPLHSSGELIFIPQKGLYRKLTTPFVQELLITATALQQRDAHGTVETLALESVPLAKALVEGFLAVFSGSWDSLQSHFQVYFSSENPHWTLGLTPRHTAMTQIISCILLEGDHEHVGRLWVRETNGDVTRDQFFEAHILTPEHWADYQRYFEWGH
jgi:hypothetical protein